MTHGVRGGGQDRCSTCSRIDKRLLRVEVMSKSTYRSRPAPGTPACRPAVNQETTRSKHVTGQAGGAELARASLVAGLPFGAAVWAASYLGWLPAIGFHRPAVDEPPARNALMIVSHFVWAGTLALFVAALDDRPAAD